jgi:hypothetical protein
MTVLIELVYDRPKEARKPFPAALLETVILERGIAR